MSIWGRVLSVTRAIPLGRKAAVSDATAALSRLRDAFQSDTDAFLNLTTKLRRADVHLIGTVVQLYCYSDFHARRIVSALEHAAKGAPRAPSKLADGKVFPTLERLAREHLPDGDLRAGVLRATATLEMHRDHRHGLAHWATRRLKGADALVMFTMNANAAERRTGMPLGAQQSRFGILSLDGFRDEVRKLEDHTNFLAVASAHIDTHIEELRESIDASRTASAGPES